MKYKKLVPCKILREFSTNAYQLELQAHIHISPTFNVVDLYKYQAIETSQQAEPENVLEPKVQWIAQCYLQRHNNLLDKIVYKKTRGEDYWEFIIKWKNSSISEATWKTETSLQREGVDHNKLIDTVFFRCKGKHVMSLHY